MSLERQTRLRPLRRAMLVGMAAVGVDLAAVGALARRVRAEEITRVPRDSERVGAENAAGDLQRAVLHEEDSANPDGLSFAGTAAWTAETVPARANRPSETVVRADVAIPDRQLTLKWTLRRNDDRSLPASHTVELIFALPPNFDHHGIQSVPGVLAKKSEHMRGVPLQGSVAKVTAGYFLIGLSALQRPANIELLKRMPWFDVPIVYDDGRRAILAFEKGIVGQRAFDEVFAAWDQ